MMSTVINVRVLGLHDDIWPTTDKVSSTNSSQIRSNGKVLRKRPNCEGL